MLFSPAYVARLISPTLKNVCPSCRSSNEVMFFPPWLDSLNAFSAHPSTLLSSGVPIVVPSNVQSIILNVDLLLFKFFYRFGFAH